MLLTLKCPTFSHAALLPAAPPAPAPVRAAPAVAPQPHLPLARPPGARLLQVHQQVLLRPQQVQAEEDGGPRGRLQQEREADQELRTRGSRAQQRRRGRGGFRPDLVQ